MSPSYSIEPSAGPIPRGTDLRAPLDVPLLVPDAAWELRMSRLAWGFVALGIAVRLSRYLLRFPLWGDECYLAANFLDRGYLDLLRPLDSRQVAPLAFLWVELTAVKLLGFSEWSLRLFPTICGLASVVLFRHTAGRLLRGAPLVLAVAFFAVAYYPIRHSAEVKPYASDLFVSLVFLAMAVQWWQNPARSRWLWALACVSPILVALSYPAVFVAGGISLAVLWPVWQTRNRPAMAAWAVFNLAVGGTFLAVLWASSAAQFQDSGNAMLSYWAGSFPPLGEPLKLAVWFVGTHTGEMLAYPVGGQRGGSTLTFLLCVVAAVVMFRRGQRTILAMVLGTLVLAFLAAAIHRYPYGGNSRLVQYLTPPACLMAGLGAAVLLARLRTWQAQRLAAGAVLLTMAGLGFGILLHDLARPYKIEADFDHRGFARWFWTQAADADTLCVLTDFEKQLYSESYETIYRCNQRIYSPFPHGGSRPVRLDALAAGKPLRCVVYSTEGAARDERAFREWLGQMESRYRLAGSQRYTVQINTARREFKPGYYDVYRFEPKSPDAVARQPSRAKTE
jgi:hypothetical protein